MTPTLPVRRRPLALVLVVGLGAALMAAWLELRPLPTHAPELPTADRRVPTGSASTPLAPPGTGSPQVSSPADAPTATPRTPRAAADVRGFVLDESDRPIAGAQVSLCAVDPVATRGVPVADGEPLSRVESGRDGAFTLPAPRTPLARLTASAAGRASAAAWVDPAGARLTLRLAPEAVLVVEVLDSEGVPEPDAEVEAQAGRLLVRVRTESGRALLRGLPEGAVRLRAVSPGRGVGEAGPIEARAGERREVVVVLARAARIAGQVLDAESGAPVPGARVLFARPGRSVAAEPTDAEGRFAAVLAGGAGEAVEVSITAEGRAPRLEPLTLTAWGAEPLELRFELEPALPWSGLVEDASGRPAAGVRVGYTSDGVVGRERATTLSDAQGRFALPPPPPPAPGRRVVLTAELAGERAALALRPGMRPPDPLVLTLASGASVRGQVRDREGRPLAGVLARLQPAWDRLAERADADLLHAVNAERAGGFACLSGADGTWALDAVPRGLWRLSLERDGAARTLGEPFPITAGEVDLGPATLGSGLSIRGHVRTADGRPVSGALVSDLDGGGAGRGPTSMTDALGAYVLTDLAVGAHTLEARAGARTRATAQVDLEADAVEDLTLPEGAALALEVEHATQPYRGLVTLTLRSARGSSDVVHRETVRIAEGRGELRGLPVGLWRLALEAPGGLEASAPGAVRLDERAATAVRLLLAPAARLVGTVLDMHGVPVREGRVRLEATESEPARLVRLDAGGRFRLEGLPAARARVRAEGRGGAPVERDVAWAEGSSQELELRLAPAGTLEVRVRDAAGRAVAGALLSFRAADRATRLGEAPPLRTDRDGRARRADLPLVPIVVEARSSEGAAGTGSATPTAGTATTVELRLSRPP